MIERYGKELAQPAVRMHAQDSDVLTVVVVSGAAGSAFSAVQVGLDRTVVPHRYPPVVGGRFHHFRSQLMPNHPRIGEEGLTTVEGVEIRATDTHAMNP